MFDIWIGNRGISHHIRGFHGFLKMFQNPMNEHNETITQRVFFWIAPHGQPNSPPARHGLESCPHPGRQFHFSDLGGRNCYAKFANNSGNPKWNSKNKKSTYVNMVNFELLRVFASGFYKLKTDFSTVRSPAPPAVRGFVSDVTRWRFWISMFMTSSLRACIPISKPFLLKCHVFLHISHINSY